MSLATPERIRSLQRKLYCTAKAKPAFRFYTLYDKICRADILAHAYEVAHSNAGAPGVDGRTFEQAAEDFFDPFLKVVDASRNEVIRPQSDRRSIAGTAGSTDREGA